MKLTPWRELATPHADVLAGNFQQAEFAADLARVHDGTAIAEYQDPVLFFQRTFITAGMQQLLQSVLGRLSGKEGEPVIQLQTAFGGGKTHTMLAAYHLACAQASAGQLRDMDGILKRVGISALPRARVAVLDGNRYAPAQPMERDGQRICTIWGDMAWQLGGAEGFALLAASDAAGTAPGKDILQKLLMGAAPCLILMDEMVAYMRQFEEGRNLPGGTFDSNISFVQQLTEALKAVDTAALLASLPESRREAGSTRGQQALASLEQYFGRVQAIWRPVEVKESFEIVRRRLFAKFAGNGNKAKWEVCRAFEAYYHQHAGDFPEETQKTGYFERLVDAYPIHPELFDRLYEDWSTLPNFQRTRGVLKLMAKVIHRLWKNNADAFIMPGNLPLDDADVRTELINYLPQGWDAVVTGDVDGESAEAGDIDAQDAHLGRVQACRRAARTLFLGSATGAANSNARGLDAGRITLGAAQPGQAPALFQDALGRMEERLHHLGSANGRYWLDTHHNLLREMQDHRRRISNEQVASEIRDLLQKQLRLREPVHVFPANTADVPDDRALCLVALPPDAAFSTGNRKVALGRAQKILETHGNGPRLNQNRLIFLAADFDAASRLREQVSTALAWRGISDDFKADRLVLDNLMSAQIGKSLKAAEDAARRMVREAYRWLLAPMQDASAPGEVLWEHCQLGGGDMNWGQDIARTLKENEWVIDEWAPVHVHGIFKRIFWKDGAQDYGAQKAWEQFCQYLYLPRLKDEGVFRAAITAGTASADFFGIAQGREGDKYLGFSYAQPATPIMDADLLLIAPDAAAVYARALKEQARTEPPGSRGGGEGTGTGAGAGGGGGGSTTQALKKRFYASIDLNPVLAKKQFADVVDEVVQQFTTRADLRVQIAVEIQAESDAGFDDGLQRAVKENCSVLHFRNAEFED